LVIGTITAHANSVPNLEGFYYNPDYGIEIFVESSRNQLKVKGLSDNKRWQNFRRIDRNFWQDRRGNTIVIGKRSQLIFHSKNRVYRKQQQILHFYKSKVRGYSRKNSLYYKDRSRDRNRSSYRPDRTDLYGNWYSNDFRLNMYIEPTRDGLRCRLENEDSWTYYNKSDRDNYWEDQKGNKLIEERKGSLYWQSKNGRRKIELSKQNR
jgi:hypothetical protein